MIDNIYTRFGKKYRKIGRDEIIQKGAMHSYCHGELKPILNPKTIGNTPSNFSDERDFYNPIDEGFIHIHHHLINQNIKCPFCEAGIPIKINKEDN